MPDDTQQWLGAFVRGINYYQSEIRILPHELSVLPSPLEDWVEADIVTLGRLIAADINWLVWLRLLRFRDRADWRDLWHRILRSDLLSTRTESAKDFGYHYADLLGSVGRSGSNSFALSAAKSFSGGAAIGNDPHLQIGLPNPFLLAGIYGPSYHAVGFMVPGIPCFVTGRNKWIAWGGAALHAASSEFVSVGPKDQSTERVEKISVRGRRTAVLRVRETPWGPIVSDLPLLAAKRKGKQEAIALRWVGHQPSDEITALLRVGRARNWNEFSGALAEYAVPGLQMTFADTSGQIGQLMAVKLPRRSMAVPPDIVNPPNDEWDDLLNCKELPARYAPEEGFSPPDRLHRLRRLLGDVPKLEFADLVKIQCDVHSETALMQRDRILFWLQGTREPGEKEKTLIDALENWSGEYKACSEGAMAFELLMFHLSRQLVKRSDRKAYEGTWGMRSLIWNDICSVPQATRENALRCALRRAAKGFRSGEQWGSKHRLTIFHFLGIFPILRARYRFADFPASGSSETLMKTAHPLTNRRHHSYYGSVARHISELSDDDRNYFVLLGGQDGCLGSTTSGDQVEMWRNGRYIKLPLRIEEVRAKFPFHTTISP
jgi:penicillin amidase